MGVKSRKMRCAEHLARMEEMKNGPKAYSEALKRKHYVKYVGLDGDNNNTLKK